MNVVKQEAFIGRLLRWAVTVVAVAVLFGPAAQAQVTIFSEDFDGLPLGPNEDEGLANDAAWTATPPSGWSVDNTGVPGFGNPDDNGCNEFSGWTFMDRDWWVETADDQTRSQFTNASGAVMVADPDEWDDCAHADSAANGWFDATSSTPPISLIGIEGNSVALSFDSSWRDEFDSNYHQSASVMVSYDGGSPVEVLLWLSDPNSPNFKDDAQNENVSFDLNNPAGASSMVLSFRLFDAGNDWWWAVDNIVVTGAEAAQGGPFRENLIADNGAELDVNLEETIPVDNTETTRISPLWLLAPELEAAGYAIGSRGTSGRFGSDFTIPFRGQAHFTIVNQSNPDPRARNATGLGAMHQTFDLLALGFTEEELDAGDVLVAFGGFFAGWNGQGDSIQVLVQGRSDDANFNILDNPEDDLGSTATTNFCVQAWTANGAMGSDGSVSNWWGITNQGLGEPKLFRTTFGDGRNQILGRFQGAAPAGGVPIDPADKVDGTLSGDGFRVRVVTAGAAISSEFRANQLLCGDIEMLTDGTGDLPVIDMADPASNGAGAGLFVGLDDPFPTLSTTVDNDDFVVHVEGWLDMPAGTYALGVNSDDGMRLDIGGVRVVALEGNRGPATTWGMVTVAEAGAYPFRLTMHERGGGSAVELLEADTASNDDANVALINDTPARIKAFITNSAGAAADFLPPLCPATAAPPTSFTTGAWAADSDVNPGTPDFLMNEELITASVSLIGHEQARLALHSGYKAHPTQIADIDVSTDGGTTWTNIWRRFDASDAFGTDAGARAEFDELLDIDISAVADGQANVQVRFHFFGTEGPSGMDSLDNWLWIIDDVAVSAVPTAGGDRVALLSETFDTPDLPIGWSVVDGGDPADARGGLRTWYYTSSDLEASDQPVSVEREMTIVEQEVDVNCFKNQPGEEPIFETLPVVTEVDGQPVLTQWTYGDGSVTNILRDQPLIFKPGALVPLETPASLESANGIRFLRFTLIGVREGGGDSDGYIDETYMRLVQGDDVPSDVPELLQIMDGLGGINPDTGLADTFISPLGEDVPFDTVDFDLTADVEFATEIPGFTLTSNGGGNHTLTSDGAVPVGTCFPLSFDVRDLATGAVSTIAFTVCHLPLDVNQDGQVNIQDITAWGAEFNGAKRASLIDTNGDGNVNVQDATQVGNMWFGRPPATVPWNGESLP